MFVDRWARLAPVAVLCVAATAAAADEPALTIEASPSSVRVGDHVRVLAQARGGGDGWLWGELTVAVEPDGPWAIVSGPTAIAGTRPPAWELTLVPLELGELTLPRMTASGRPTGEDAVAIECDDAPVVTVVSVFGDDDDQERRPAPLRDPIGVRGLPWEWIVPLLAVLAPVFAGLAWWWRGRRPVGAIAYEELPPLAQLEAVLSDLGGRIGREPADGICDGLAAGLRRFLERRTGEPAGEMTSFELRLLARRRGWPETVQRSLQRAMAVADAARFSRRPTGDDELAAALDTALEAGRAVEALMSEPEDERAAEGG